MRLLLVAVLCLLLGAYAGATSADQNARRAAVANARIVLWATVPGPSVETGATTMRANAVVVGGPVLLHALRTRFGTMSVPKDVPLTSTAPSQFTLDVKVDCSLFSRWRDDPSTVPSTGTAVVRDRPGDPLREVPVDLEGYFVVAVLYSGCQTDPNAVAASDAGSGTATSGDSAGQQSAGAPAVVAFLEMTGNASGQLSYTAALNSNSPYAVFLDTPVLDLIAGRGAGKFTVVARPEPPYNLAPGDQVKVLMTLSYICTKGKQVLPWSTQILNPSVTSAGTGEAGFVGWDPVQAGIAVRGAIAKAGCSPPDDGASLVVQ